MPGGRPFASQLVTLGPGALKPGVEDLVGNQSQQIVNRVSAPRMGVGSCLAGRLRPCVEVQPF